MDNVKLIYFNSDIEGNRNELFEDIVSHGGGGVLLLVGCGGSHQSGVDAPMSSLETRESSVLETIKEFKGGRDGDVLAEVENTASDPVEGRNRHWGTWLLDPDNGGDAFSVWYDIPQDSNKYPDESWRPLTGSAVYDGDAEGFAYMGDYADEFTADIRLEAAFGTAEEPMNINGSIDKFRFKGTNPPDISKWDAGLNVNIADGYSAFDVSNIRDATRLQEGYWRAIAWTKGSSSNPPEGITGYVDLTFEDGRAVGSFNAEIQE